MKEKAPEENITFRALLAETVKTLSEAGIAEPEADAFWLFAYVTGFDRGRYLLHAGETAGADTVSRLHALSRERSRRIPLQYLTGEAAFADLSLSVSEDVLIPRLDTECLLQEAGQWLSDHYRDDLRVLDLCTGSGCLALAIKKMFPEIACDASDISEAALAVARANAFRLNLAVRFFQGNLMEPFQAGEDRFDLIVSNPPYIPSGMIPLLDPEVRDHEPRLALDGGEDGLCFYRRITAAAARFLKQGGMLMFEIGAEQGEALRRLLADQGFDRIRICADLSGKDRVASACLRDPS